MYKLIKIEKNICFYTRKKKHKKNEIEKQTNTESDITSVRDKKCFLLKHSATLLKFVVAQKRPNAFSCYLKSLNKI